MPDEGERRFDREVVQVAAGRSDPALDKALEHPLRRRFVAALWHSSEPLTARRIKDEYLEGTGLRTVVYHLRVLEAAGVVETADPPTPGVVLGGDKAAEAVRRLGLGRARGR